MPAFSRRAFMKTSVAAAMAAGAIRANPLGLPIGSQTYPHRQRIQSGDFAGICRDFAAQGIVNLELCSPAYPEFAGLANGKETRKILDGAGLRCPSAHFELAELRERQQQAISWAHDIGMTQMGTASLEGHVENGGTTMDIVKRAADEYNKIGEAAAKAGMQQFLHDERFEMAKVDGRLVYEILLELLDPKLVKMQFQMSAMPAVGDPVTYFNKYPGRFISLHLQGVNLDPPPPPPAGERGRSGRGGRGPQLAVGKDSVDWKRIFAAAPTGGVKNYFIEQSWDLTVQSAAYLKSLT